MASANELAAIATALEAQLAGVLPPGSIGYALLARAACDAGARVRAVERSDVQEAASINCGACDFCAAVHVNLIDESGEIFATASVPAAIGEEFIARFRTAMSEVAKRSPAPGRIQ